MIKWFSKAFTFLFPAQCTACGRLHLGEHPWCERCEEALPWWTQRLACMRCGARLACDEELWCVRCKAKAPAFDAAYAAFWYEPPVEAWMQRFKFKRELIWEAVFAEAILARFPKPPVAADALVPIPLARKRLAERGFNQAALIAQRLARIWQIPYRATWLMRQRASATQSRLTIEERARNAENLFVVPLMVRRALHGAAVVVVDDVLTTGATAEAAARALRRGGARQVVVITAARASSTPRTLF